VRTTSPLDDVGNESPSAPPGIPEGGELT
jgi:hypothetical protein